MGRILLNKTPWYQNTVISIRDSIAIRPPAIVRRHKTILTAMMSSGLPKAVVRPSHGTAES